MPPAPIPVPPAPLPIPAPSPAPLPIPAPAPAPYLRAPSVTAAAPPRRQNHTRKHLNTQLRAALASLHAVHRPMLQLQFLLRSLYRRTARAMLENTAAPVPVGAGRLRLARRTAQMRSLVRAARRSFSLVEARAGVVLAHVRFVCAVWREQVRVPVGAAGGFPRVFGRAERRMWVLLDGRVGAWEEVYHDVGVMVRDFFEEGAEMYCGMQ